MRLIDPGHPFFKPAWRRYVIVIAPFLWAAVEWTAGNQLWAYLFAAIGGYLAWNLVIAWREDDED